MIKTRRKYIPCYVVLRMSNETDHRPHVLGVYEHFDQAECCVDKNNAVYKEHNVPLYCEIQPADYCTQ